ncbi:hypothetical protein EC845_4068 [Comamonas sp. BIGb0124]|uniref:hypothetical protein n=1 Tax=Comamonas sp. BIGb0124 TaxID=2485130 RepID=UPI000F4724C6|nr:hypothetical protein [Comamonas sp. BIGb0124]ROR17027.1 hypothetical protein EC845_4068 [Comamonas sp. BIGb0124]
MSNLPPHAADATTAPQAGDSWNRRADARELHDAHALASDIQAIDALLPQDDTGEGPSSMWRRARDRFGLWSS